MLKRSRGQRKTAGYRQLLLPNMLANSSENVDNAAAAADDDDDDYDDGGDDDIYGHDHDFAICLKKGDSSKSVFDRRLYC